MYPIHPARTYRYKDLAAGLQEAVQARLVTERACGDLRLYCYTQSCVYDRAWNEFTTLARGLILDTRREAVVATPFPKFFNLGERADQTLLDVPFEVFEKLDGSLIVIFHDSVSGVWRCATKGSFESEQARAAEKLINSQGITGLTPGNTYLAEYVGPQNRIVVPYQQEELVLLAVYGEEGNEYAYPMLELLAYRLGWKVSVRHQFESVSDLVTHTSGLPATEEGFVIRFQDGLRLKVKGEEYRRLHAMISRVTPLGVWEAMTSDSDLSDVRRQLPEEFLTDFDAIAARLKDKLTALQMVVAIEAEHYKNHSNKELGLILDTIPDQVRPFLFTYRNTGGDLMISPKTKKTLFRTIRPTANRLAGYTPSYAMNRVMEESL